MNIRGSFVVLSMSEFGKLYYLSQYGVFKEDTIISAKQKFADNILDFRYFSMGGHKVCAQFF